LWKNPKYREKTKSLPGRLRISISVAMFNLLMPPRQDTPKPQRVLCPSGWSVRSVMRTKLNKGKMLHD